LSPTKIEVHLKGEEWLFWVNLSFHGFFSPLPWEALGRPAVWASRVLKAKLCIGVTALSCVVLHFVLEASLDVHT